MGTRYPGTEKEIRALNAFLTLIRSADTISTYSHAHLKDAELTLSQFACLEALFYCGELCQGELAAKLLRTMGTVTSLVAGLEKRKLAERVPDPSDKRFVRVRLTPKGRALIGRIMPKHVGLITDRFQALSADEQERLRALCRKLGKGHG